MRVGTGFHATMHGTDDGHVSGFPNVVRRPQLFSADSLEWGATVLDVDELGAGRVWLPKPGFNNVVVASPLLYGFRATEPCVVTLSGLGGDATVTAVRASGVGDVTVLDDVRHEVGVVAWDIRTVT